MRRPLLALLLALLLACAALTVAADGGEDGSRQDGDDRGDGDRKGRGDHGDRDDHDDKDEEEDGDRRERGEKHERKAKKAKEPKARRDAEPAAPVLPVAVALSGDAAVRQSVRNEPGHLAYLIVVGGLGPGPAEGVRLAADLPDLGTRWSLSGAGSEGCSVVDSRLACDWGDLGAGDLRVLQASAAMHRAPAWQVDTIVALEAGNDRDRRNDAAATTLGILLT